MKLLDIFRQSDQERAQIILHGNLKVSILVLAAPAMLMMLTQSGMSVIDNWFIYNFASYEAAASISFGNIAYNIVVSFGVGLGVAGVAVLSRLNGAGDVEGGRYYTRQFVMFMTLISLVAALITLVTAPLYARMALPELRDGVRRMLTMSAMVVPFAFFLSQYNSIKNASGKTETPFRNGLLLLASKVAGDALFVAHLRMGITGVVLATLCAHLIVGCVIARDMFFSRKGLRVSFKGARLEKQAVSTFTRIGIPAALGYMAEMVGFLLISTQSMAFGTMTYNSVNISNTIAGMLFNVVQAFGVAVTATVSLNIGAGNVPRAKKAFRTAAVFALSTSAVCVLLLVLFASPVSGWFTSDPDMLQMCAAVQRINAFGAFGLALVSVFNGVFTAFGRTKITLVVALTRVWLFRYGFIVIMVTFFNANYLVLPTAMVFGNVVATIVSYLFLRRIPWEKGALIGVGGARS